MKYMKAHEVYEAHEAHEVYGGGVFWVSAGGASWSQFFFADVNTLASM